MIKFFEFKFFSFTDLENYLLLEENNHRVVLNKPSWSLSDVWLMVTL